MPDGRTSVESRSGTWVLQADAAARAACSLSAIRKWRRSGAVKERMTTNAAGQERVEVRLEDVMARVEKQPGEPRRAVPSAEEGLLPGAVVITLADLEELFERAAHAERRVEEGESRLQVAEDEARFLLGRLAELRQQLDAARARSVAETRQPPPAREPSPAVVAPPPPPPPRAETARPLVPPTVRPPRKRAPADNDGLRTELHRLYVELHSSRPSARMSPDDIRRRRRTLAAYDVALLKACEALEVPGRPTGPGAPLDPERRTALSRGLAAAGLDVRVPPMPARLVEPTRGVGRP